MSLLYQDVSLVHLLVRQISDGGIKGWVLGRTASARHHQQLVGKPVKWKPLSRASEIMLCEQLPKAMLILSALLYPVTSKKLLPLSSLCKPSGVD